MLKRETITLADSQGAKTVKYLCNDKNKKDVTTW